jgi:phage recombination protein Bet
MTTPDTALAVWSNEEVAIIRSVIAPGLSDGQLAFFAQVCRATGLNPIMNQIVPILRNDKNAPGGKKLTIQTTIHGLRLIADRTGRYAPGPLTTFEMRADGKTPDSATAYVRKFAGNVWHDVSEVAYWDEYVQQYNGQPSALWATKPRVMLAKCAEALALRRAFPAEMAGLYVDEEMPEAAPVVTVSATSAAAGAPIAPLPATNLATHGVQYEMAKGRENPPPPALRAPEPDPGLDAARAALKAAMAAHNWTPKMLLDAAGTAWPHVLTQHDVASLTAFQVGRLTDVVTGESVIDAHGKIVPASAAKADTDLPLGVIGDIAAAVR